MISNNHFITYKDAFESALKVLENSNVPCAKVDAMELLLFASGFNHIDYAININEKVPSNILSKYTDVIQKRAKRIPLQHLIGTAPFYGRDFIVNENVLIPRMDTEVVTEKAIELINNIKKENISVLDLCSGSGCIGITIDLETNNNVKVCCTDVSYKALEVAKTNAKYLKADIDFIESDMFTNISKEFDVIVSNPPYISKEEMNSLEPEVSKYDPRIALTDEDDGLKFYKIIALGSKKHLKTTGKLILEIGYNQAIDIENILKETGYFKDIKVYKDLAGLDRVVTAIKL